MNKIKIIIKKLAEVVAGYPNSTAAWAFRTIMLLLLIKIAFFNDAKVITKFKYDSEYQDSLEIERYKIKVLEEYLIKNKIQDEKDSINLTRASIDSLISYIANREMASSRRKTDK